MKITINMPYKKIKNYAFTLLMEEVTDWPIDKELGRNKFRECVICALEDSIKIAEDFIIAQAVDDICTEFATELDELLEKENG